MEKFKEYSGFSLTRGNKTQQEIAKQMWVEIQKAAQEINKDEYLKLIETSGTSITFDYSKFVTGGVFIFADIKNYVASKLFRLLNDKTPNLKWYDRKHTSLQRGKLVVSVYNPNPNSWKNHVRISQEITIY